LHCSELLLYVQYAQTNNYAETVKPAPLNPGFKKSPLIVIQSLKFGWWSGYLM
jgi:hypothetical protein